MISSGSGERSAAGKRLYWIGVLLALAVGLPFLNKPFHIDDTMVLAVSSQILREPLRPFHASINWSGDPVPIFEKTTNPPLVSYVLAPLVARFGYREAPLHLAMLGFLVILGLAMAWLARRFAGGSVWPVLFVMLSPGVAASVNVMRDVPMMALSAAAVAVFAAGVDRRRWPLALGGAALAGLAMLTKYSAVILFPVLLGYALLRRRGRYGLWLAAAAALVGLWCLQTQLTEGRVHLIYLLTTGRGGQPWTNRFYAALVTVGALRRRGGGLDGRGRRLGFLGPVDRGRHRLRRSGRDVPGRAPRAAGSPSPGPARSAEPAPERGPHPRPIGPRGQGAVAGRPRRSPGADTGEDLLQPNPPPDDGPRLAFLRRLRRERALHLHPRA